MSGPTREQLWETLRAQGLAQGDLPARGEAESPWYVRAMLGFAGWIGAMFLLGFVGAALSFVMKSGAASLALGAACCAAAWFMFRAMQDNDFGTQFALAVSLAGQGLIGFGLFDSLRGESPIAWLAMCGVELVLAWLIPNFIHRVLTTWAAMVFLWLALARLGIYGMAPAVAAAAFATVWLDEKRWARDGAFWRPIGFGMALALLQLDGTLLFGGELWGVVSREVHGGMAYYGPRIGAAMVAAVFLLSMWKLMRREGLAPGSRAGAFALIAAIAVAAFSFAAHGLTTALLVLLVGYGAGNRVLVGLGLAALAFFLSHYYYTLNTTLLVKSMMLAIAGAVLLGGRLLMHALLPGEHDA